MILSLSLIYLFFIAVDLPELFWCLETLKRIIQYFFPLGQLDGLFFPLSVASQCWRLCRQGIILHMMQHSSCFS